MPLVEFSFGNLQAVPVFVAIEYLCVFMPERFTVNAGVHRFVDFPLAGPDVPQIHGLAIGSCSQRAVDQVDVHVAGQRIGHHQRRRSEKIHSDQRMNAALEISVAREHGATHQLAAFHRFPDFRPQRPRISDACGATVADQVKAHFLQVIQQVRFLEIVADHPRSRRQAALDPRFGFKSFCGGVPCQQTGRHHHGRVRRVRATGNGRDQDRPIAKLKVLATHADFGPAVTFSAAGFLRQVVLEHRGRRFQGDPVLRPFRPGNAWFDTGYVQFQDVTVICVGLSILTPQTLGPGVGFDQFDGVRIAPAQFEVAEGFTIDREYCASTAELRRHIGQRRPIGKRQVRQPVAEELDKFSNHAFFTKHLGNGEYQVGRGGALR
ncbi:hypothetical protein MnTg04_00509 [bacterium MnTg04]|nr:hypothetical protein MnTg04_00509 [bacterium MnTg04]